MTKGSHLESITAIVTYRKKKLGVWLVDHSGLGINEMLVEEKLAKYTENDENLINMITNSGGHSGPASTVSNLPEQLLDLHSVVKSSGDRGAVNVRHLVLRSLFVYEELSFLQLLSKSKRF